MNNSPAELKDAKNRKEFSATLHCEKDLKDLALCTYTVKTKSSGKKKVLLLSIVRPLPGIIKDGNKQRQSIYRFYELTKGGKDIVDQLNDFYTTRSKSKRWDILIFFYMLDTIRVNLKMLFCIKRKLDIKEEDTFSITYELVKSLVYPFLEQQDLNGLCTETIRKIDFILNREPENVTIDLHIKNYRRLRNNRRRCHNFNPKKKKN